MKYNYHMHSCHSDGTDTPEELIELAADHGIMSVALTDHDTIDGVEAFLKAANNRNITAIPAVEISSRIGNQYVHILGYGIDITSEDLLQTLHQLTLQATEYTEYVFKHYVADKYRYSWEQVLSHNRNRKGLYLNNLYSAMLNDGLFNSWSQFPGFVNECFQFERQRYGAPAETTIEMIKNSGGKAFLAHPKLMKLSPGEELNTITKLKDLGLDGIEAYYPEHSPKESSWYELIAEKLALNVSGGTDWHGFARLKSPLYFVGDVHID